MEQRIRRAIAVGMSNLAHLGIEDFMNDTFTSYSSTLFPVSYTHLDVYKRQVYMSLSSRGRLL